MKKTILSTAVASAIFLVGCGSSSETANSSSVGEAFYLDSAVEGVRYECGTQNGLTDNKGGFKFEKNQGCKLFVGDILLKEIKATNLKDNGKVLESNVTVASFLQTLDNDGDASNGIEITAKTVAQLKAAKIVAVPETEAELTDVWSGLKNNNAEYKGRIVDRASALEHLTETKARLNSAESHAQHGEDSGELLAYFGDKENNRIVVVDVNEMKLVDEILTGNQKSYAAEIIKTKIDHGNMRPKMYVDNRGSDIIDVVDSATNEIVKSITLPFHPRSINVNEDTGLVVVSGVDKAMIAVIDSKTDELIATVGNNVVTYPTTSGHSYISSGTLASGHPEWLNSDHFVLLDRQNLTISTYKIFKNSSNNWETTLVNTIETPSPIHNLIPPKIHGKAGHKDNTSTKQEKHGSTQHGHGGEGESMQYSSIFYATAEGATDVYPSVLKLEFTAEKGLTIVDELEIKKEGLSANIMGVHHLNFMRNQKYIYVGSDEGNLFVVNYQNETMSVEKTVMAGKGAGHSDEMKHGDYVVVINHKDKFITLMNSSTNEKIADIEVSNISDDLVNKVQTQSHPMYHFSKDGKYFYLFLTEEGALVKVDLEDKKVVSRLEIGGKLAMGSFLGH